MSTPRGTRRGPRRSDAARVGPALAAIACALLSVWLHRRSLAAFFSPDDLISLERVRGLLPPHPVGWWRFLAGPGYFAAASRLFGGDPVPYHVVNMVLHATNVVALFALVRRWGGSVWSATIAAAWFGTTRLFEVVLQQAVGVGELLSLGLVIASLLVLDPRRGRTLIPSVLLFLAALLAKESVMLVPLIVLLPLWPESTWRERTRAAAALAAVSLGVIGALTVSGVGAAAFGGEAYAIQFGANLWHNLMTYAAMSVDYVSLTPDLGSTFSTTAWHVGIVVLVLAAAVAAWGAPESWRAAAGLAWWLLAVIPVLPLTHHTYVQYLYASFAGLGIVAGEAWNSIAVAWMRRPSRSERKRGAAPQRARGSDAAAITVWTLTAALIGAHVIASDRLLRQRAQQRIPGLDLASDPQVRKSEVLRNIVRSVATVPAGSRLLFYVPRELERYVDPVTGQSFALPPGESDPRFQDTFDRVLALRSLVPQIGSVVFVERWSPTYDGYDIVLSDPTGKSVVLGHDAQAHEKLVASLISSGFESLALEHLSLVAPRYPNDLTLGLLQARALIRLGRRDEAAPIVDDIVHRAGPGPVGDAARALQDELSK